MSAENTTHCGYVAVIGAPNAGKSTLVNTLVGAKVSIVSSKVQTTRTRVMGIVVQDNAQIIFVDTPGIFEPDPKSRMEKAIVFSAWEALEGADALILLVDADAPKKKETMAIIDRLKAAAGNPRPVFLVLNKIDRAKRPNLLVLTQKLNEAYPFAATFMVSAQTGDGLSDIMAAVTPLMPPGPFMYPEDQMTDMPMRLLAAEITREKLFTELRQELPYALTVETENWEPFDNGDIKIDQTIYVTRDTHKSIILGKGGAMISKVGQAARVELESILETRVHLKLFVKVRENWMDKSEHYTLWGLDPNR
jgi:GTP-binding protein Era